MQAIFNHSKKRAVFLDRDGVLNEAVVRDGKPYPPPSVEETHLVAGAKEALERLKALGFYLLVVTNQPDVARGNQTLEEVEAINTYLIANLPLDKIYSCYHDDKDYCQCRKPLPGLILQAAEEWQVNLSASFMIGDRWKDVAAGQQAGCTTFLIEMGYTEPQKVEPNYRVATLEQAIELILGLTARKGIL